MYAAVAHICAICLLGYEELAEDEHLQDRAENTSLYLALQNVVEAALTQLYNKNRTCDILDENCIAYPIILQAMLLYGFTVDFKCLLTVLRSTFLLRMVGYQL